MIPCKRCGRKFDSAKQRARHLCKGKPWNWKHAEFRHREFRKNAVIRVNMNVMAVHEVCTTCDNLTLHYKVKHVRGMVCGKQISGLRLSGRRVVYE